MELTLEKQIMAFIKNVKKGNLFKVEVPKTAQETIPFSYITQDGIINYEEDVYTTAFSLGNINYSMSKEEEKENIYEHYCKFLNKHTNEFQVYLTNDIMNASDFIDGINEKHETNQEDLDYFRDWLLNLAEKKKVSDKRRYLILRCKSNKYDNAVNEFDRQYTQIVAHFKKFTEVRRVGALEYLKLFFDYFNYSYKYTNPFDLSQECFIKGTTIKDMLAPQGFNFKPATYFMSGQDYKRVLFVAYLPNVLSDEFLNDLLLLPFTSDISIHYSPTEKGDAVEYVSRRITSLDANKIAYQEKKKAVPYDLKRSLRSAEKMHKAMLDKDQSYFGVGIYIGLTAKSLEELDEMSLEVVGKCKDHSVRALYATQRQEYAMAGLLPLCNNKMNLRRGVLTEQAGIFIPFTAQDVFSKSKYSLTYGINELSRSLIVFDRVNDLKVPSGLIIGIPGGGKSSVAKIEAERAFLTTDCDFIFVDPEDEYAPLTDFMKGSSIDISASSENHMNLFDMDELYGDDEPPVNAKIEFLLGIFERFLGSIDASERSILDRVTRQSYQKYIDRGFNRKYIPTLEPWFDILCKQPEPEAKKLAVALELYVKGSLNIFNHPTNVDMHNRVTRFNIKNLGKQLMPTGLNIVNDFVWNKLVENRKRRRITRIVSDEYYLQFDNQYSAKQQYELFKRIRKYFGVFTGVTHQIEEFLKSDYAKNMLLNTQFLVLMDQNEAGREKLKEVLGLSDEQLKYITNAEQGHGLMKIKGSVYPCDFVANDFEKELIATKISEV